MVVVRVGEVAEGDRHTVLLHLATYDSVTAGDMPSKPGKPTWPLASRITFPNRSSSGRLLVIWGATYLCPNKAW